MRHINELIGKVSRLSTQLAERKITLQDSQSPEIVQQAAMDIKAIYQQIENLNLPAATQEIKYANSQLERLIQGFDTTQPMTSEGEARLGQRLDLLMAEQAQLTTQQTTAPQQMRGGSDLFAEEGKRRVSQTAQQNPSSSLNCCTCSIL